MSAIEFRRTLVAAGIKAGLDVDAALEAAKAADAWCVEGGTQIKIETRPLLIGGPVIEPDAPHPRRGRPKRRAKPAPAAKPAKNGKIGDALLMALVGAGDAGLSFEALKAVAACGAPKLKKFLDARVAAGELERRGPARGPGGRFHLIKKKLRGSSGAERRPHKPKVGGANPPPATKTAATADAGASAKAPQAGGGNGSPLSVPAADTPNPRAIVRAALETAGPVGLSKSALQVKTGLGDVELDGGLSACLVKREAVERDRVFYAAGTAR